MELFTRIGAAILLIVGGGLWFFAPTTDRLTAHSEVAPHLLSDSSPNRSVPKIDLLATHGLDGIVAYAETQTQSPKPTPANGPSCDVLDPDQGFVDEMLVRFAEDGSKSYERRVALVIGNGNYQGAIGRLDNPANDATSMANVMSALGFTVYRGIDLDADGLERCLSRFTTELQAKPTDIALFFYAGHGIQLVSETDNEKRNYMMATDARIEASGEGVGYKQIDAVLNEMRDHSEQSVFFYDACRDYPLGNQRPASIDGNSIKRGIAMIGGPAAMALKQKEADDRAGIYIAYATAPNRVADDAYESGAYHSPFTKALLNNIATPGYSLKKAMSYASNDVGELTDWNQTPWTRSSLVDEVTLNGRLDLATYKSTVNQFADAAQNLLADERSGEALAKSLAGIPTNWTASGQIRDLGRLRSSLFQAHNTKTVRFVGHQADLMDLSFSADGHLLVTAAHDRTAIVWDVKTGTRLKTLNHTYSYLQGIDFCGASDQILIADRDLGISIWSATTGEIIRSITTDQKQLLAATCSPDGGRIVATFGDGYVAIWSSTNGLLERTIKAYGESDRTIDFYNAYRVVFGDDSQRFVTGGQVTQPKIWNAETGELLHSFERLCHNDFALSPNGKRIVIAGCGGYVSLYDLETSKSLPIRVIMPGSYDTTSRVSYSPDGETIAITTDQSILLVNAESMDTMTTLKKGTARLGKIEFSRSGDKIVSLLSDRTARIWRLNNIGPASSISLQDDPVRTVDYHEETDTVALSSYKRPVKLVNRSTGAELGNLGTSSSFGQSTVTKFSPDGKFIAIASNPNIEMWSRDEKTMSFSFPAHSLTINSINFSHDGSRVISTANDFTAKVWDATDGTLIETFEGHMRQLTDGVYSPDGSLIATSDGQGRVNVRSSNDGKSLFALLNENYTVSELAFSPDSKKLAGSSKRSKVWNAEDGVELCALEGNDWGPYHIYFTRDGSRIVGGSLNGHVHVWDSETCHNLLQTQADTGEGVHFLFLNSEENVAITLSPNKILETWDLGLYGPELLEAAYDLLTPELRAKAERERIRYWEVDPAVLQ